MQMQYINEQMQIHLIDVFVLWKVEQVFSLYKVLLLLKLVL